VSLAANDDVGIGEHCTYIWTGSSVQVIGLVSRQPGYSAHPLRTTPEVPRTEGKCGQQWSVPSPSIT
jgi:hypothetical protein